MVVWPESHRALWMAAAVASGWPVLRLVGEPLDVEALLLRVEELLGPLPQAIIDEPWDEGDPTWLEVALPDLTVEDAAVIAALTGDRAWFTPGPRPELALEIERGLRQDELAVFGPVFATRPIGLEGGLRPELTRQGHADAAMAALEAEIREALRAVDPGLQSWSDRGADTVAAVVDPATGRFGVVVSLLSEVFAPLDGQQLLELRRAVLEAMAGLVLARAAHDQLRLAPDLLWWTALEGMEIALWAIAPALPVEAEEVSGRCWVVKPVGERHPAQVALIPEEPGQFEEVCDRGAGIAESVGAAGGPSLWLRREGRWVFAPTWYADDWEAVEAFRA